MFGKSENSSPSKSGMIIGFGDHLRRDDGLGQYVAGEFKEITDLFGIYIYTLTMPELETNLAWQMAEADIAIFVAARDDESKELVEAEEVEPEPNPLKVEQTANIITIPALLRMVQEWYGKTPKCYLVMPKGYDFSPGPTVSEQGRESGSEAKARIGQILKQFSGR